MDTFQNNRYFVCVGNDTGEPCGWNSLDTGEVPEGYTPAMRTPDQTYQCPNCGQEVAEADRRDYSLKGVNPERFVPTDEAA